MKQFLFLLLLSINTYAQKHDIKTDTVYYDRNWKETTIKDSFFFFRPPIKKLPDGKLGVEDYYMATGKPQMKIIYESSDFKYGYATYYYENGNKSREGDLKNNAETGSWIYYHENGNKSSEGSFVNGKEDGEWKFYYDDGSIEWVEHFKKGEFHGEVLQYYRNGQLKQKEVYKHGEKESGEYYPAVEEDTTHTPDTSKP